MKLHIIVVSFFQAWMNLLRVGQFHLFKIFQLPISNFKKTIPFADLHLHVYPFWHACGAECGKLTRSMS